MSRLSVLEPVRADVAHAPAPAAYQRPVPMRAQPPRAPRVVPSRCARLAAAIPAPRRIPADHFANICRRFAILSQAPDAVEDPHVLVDEEALLAHTRWLEQRVDELEAELRETLAADVGTAAVSAWGAPPGAPLRESLGESLGEPVEGADVHTDLVLDAVAEALSAIEHEDGGDDALFAGSVHDARPPLEWTYLRAQCEGAALQALWAGHADVRTPSAAYRPRAVGHLLQQAALAVAQVKALQRAMGVFPPPAPHAEGAHV